jgi:hypothetical protein
MTVGADEVKELLGRPRVHPEHAAENDQVGMATGMYYTPVGGDIMFVEATPMPGKGDLVLTGQLGDVMKESARAAWSYAKAHAKQLGIDAEAFSQDVHIHVPAGAIPKDGPSAGVTMATALVSTLATRPVRHDIAMTGEITLSGAGSAHRRRQGKSARSGSGGHLVRAPAQGQRGRSGRPPGGDPLVARDPPRRNPWGDPGHHPSRRPLLGRRRPRFRRVIDRGSGTVAVPPDPRS